MDNPDDIRRLVERINEAWTSGRPADIGRYVHDDMTIVGPDFGVLADGRAACVASYTAFCDQARTLSFALHDVAVQIVGDTALALYRFDIRYERHGRPSHETSREIFVFGRSANGWLAVSRIIPDWPTGAPG